ncbi:hypothetical protein GCM10008967_36840 [Bacillus carboniphilus]|uniref:Uncharacterized protein n=1 Tax=Bacillus carboniphilus TaxID=86663 RepID=A0ABP3GDJ6_9BACI
MKKRWKIIAILLLACLCLFLFTNPNTSDYEVFSTDKYGEAPTDLPLEIERVNFFLFSTYTPVIASEHGITHLGIVGQFFQISDGQFDYPWWLELFN